MKKAEKAAGDLRPEYQRSDFPALVRGKYVERLRSSSNVVVLEPELKTGASCTETPPRGKIGPC
jgi:hypothetical protein